MHLHILGICGTFMGGIALLARALGHQVTGSDANVYPPMSTQLEAAGINLMEGYGADQLEPAPDVVVVGNAMKRGLPVVEAMLDRGLRYVSGPQWLREHLLRDRWVLAVAGTHGKTTTASMLAWVLEEAGLEPGFLIGGVPQGFGVSARLGSAPFFVVEADEYDTAFFDKRSKFVHYGPRTLVINNLEFDHADIFDDLTQIQRQFHHLVRTVPGSGLIVHPQGEAATGRVLAMGAWTPLESFGEGGDWSAKLVEADGSRFRVLHHGHSQQPAQIFQCGALVAVGDDVVLCQHLLREVLHRGIGDELYAGELRRRRFPAGLFPRVRRDGFAGHDVHPIAVAAVAQPAEGHRAGLHS